MPTGFAVKVQEWQRAQRDERFLKIFSICSVAPVPLVWSGVWVWHHNVITFRTFGFFHLALIPFSAPSKLRHPSQQAIERATPRRVSKPVLVPSVSHLRQVVAQVLLERSEAKLL